jgi:alkylation response protein AidB-like acyl-CoA dehydrogenase
MQKQPNNFGFGEDEVLLRDSVRKFLHDHCSADKLHRLVAGDYRNDRPIECIWDESLWQQCVDLGWASVCVPEANGGAGMPVVASVGVAEEIGRAGFPSPLLSMYNATFVLKQCTSSAAEDALSDIAGGSTITLAITNQQGSWEGQDTDVQINENRKLNGTAWFVQDARKCDRFLVSARNDTGLGLYVVDADASGLTIIPDAIVDLTRDQAHLNFHDVEAIEVAEAGSGDLAIKGALPAILCIVSADMVGAGEWLLQTTVEYAKTRIQFDRPIGFFQAIKHPLVDVMSRIDNAKSLTYSAACAIDHEPDRAELLARMAKAEASDMAVFAASRAVQSHGGIGFTWDAFIHLFFKRQMHNQVMFGDAEYQRNRLAELIIDGST